MANFFDKLDSEAKDVINYLKSRSEVYDLKIEEYVGLSQNQINEWEIKNSCFLPNDLKSFYLKHNGILIDWKFKLENSSPIPLGRIQLNGLNNLTRVGSVLNKDFNEPSLYDLEDIQTPPEALISSSITSFTSSSIVSFSNSNFVSQNSEKKKTFNQIGDLNSNSDWIVNEEEEDNESNNSGETNNEKIKGENEDGSNRLKKKIQHYQTLDYSLLPHFDESSRNFELDSCGGYGKICLVYRNSKTGSASAENAEIWFLDRSLQWHFMTNSFRNYYRLLLAHLGLPQWQMLFTEDGLPPYLYQWYYMFAPGRILIHDDTWKKLEFLNMFENNTQNNKKLQTQKSNGSTTTKKVEFAKLFEDNKIYKIKSQNVLNQNNVPNAASPNNSQNEKSNAKPKSRIVIRK